MHGGGPLNPINFFSFFLSSKHCLPKASCFLFHHALDFPIFIPLPTLVNEKWKRKKENNG